jgi:hypothetical protein
LTRFSSAAAVSCSGQHPEFFDATAKGLKIGRSGRFKGTGKRSETTPRGRRFTIRTRVTGRVKGKVIRGTFRVRSSRGREVSGTPGGDEKCVGKKIKFSARHH